MNDSNAIRDAIERSKASGQVQTVSVELTADSFARVHNLEMGKGLDFWTEASLFSAAGMTAIVYGPGDIAQAHTADEWVALEQLQRYTDSVVRMLGAQP